MRGTDRRAWIFFSSSSYALTIVFYHSYMRRHDKKYRKKSAKSLAKEEKILCAIYFINWLAVREETFPSSDISSFVFACRFVFTLLLFGGISIFCFIDVVVLSVILCRLCYIFFFSFLHSFFAMFECVKMFKINDASELFGIEFF